MSKKKAKEKRICRRRAIEYAKRKLGLSTNNIIVIIKAIWEETNNTEILPSKLTSTEFIDKQIFNFYEKNNPIIHRPKKVIKGDFYKSKEWRELRYKALKLYGRQCLCCGAKPPNVTLHVDHIKPRSKYPELELDINNLQILCEDCNLGKSNTDSIDYRP